MRNTPVDSIQDTVRQAITAGGGLEAVSSDLGLAVSSLSRASSCDEDRPGGLGVNHLHTLGRIVPASAIPIASHFARLGGGLFLPLPRRGSSLVGINSITKEFSDVLNNHVQAHSDQSENPEAFTANEARLQLREIDELIAEAAAYRMALIGRAEAG